MTYHGYSSTSPVDPDETMLSDCINTRLVIRDELRSRRGMARTSLAKISGKVLGISEFALSPGSPYAVILGTGTIDGGSTLYSLWSDVALSPLSGTTTPSTGSSFTIVVNRGSSAYATSALVFAKLDYFPNDADPGVFVGEVPMVQWGVSFTFPWTAPSSGAWKFRVYPVRDRTVGPGRNILYVGATTTNGAIYAADAIGTKVYIGGTFTSVTGTNGTFTRNRAACFDMADGSVTGWNPNLSDIPRAVVASSNTLYLGGDFTTVGGVARNYAAAIDVSGSLLTWNPNLNARCNQIAVDGSSIYLAGDFTFVGATARNRAAALDANGVILGWNPNLNNPANGVVVEDTRILLCGRFTQIGGVSHGSLIGVNKTSGAYDGSIGVTVSGGGVEVNKMAKIGTDIYFTGDFTQVGATGRNYIAAVDTTGALITSWNPNANGYGIGITATPYAVYVGGTFTTIGGAAQSYGVGIDIYSTVAAWPGVAYSNNLNSVTYLSGLGLVIAGAANDGFVRSEA